MIVVENDIQPSSGKNGMQSKLIVVVNNIPSSLGKNEIQSSLIKHELQSVAPESQPSLIQHEIQSKLIVVENEASASKTDTDMSMFRQSTSPRICKGTQFYCILQSLDASHHHDSEERYSIECFYKTTFDLLCKQTIFCEGDMYMYNQSSVPQPEFIVVSNIKPSGILANEGDLSIIQRRLIVTSSDILYKLWISCREGDQYLLYLHLQHNIPSFICANEGESVVVCPNISSVILRDEPEILLHSANPNIDQQDASSASTSSHHLYIIGYDILATLIVVLTTPIVHVCMNIIQKIIYDTQQQLHQLIKYSE